MILRLKHALHILALSAIIFGVLGAQTVVAGTVSKTLSGTSEAHCGLWELVDVGPLNPTGQSSVVSGVSGTSHTYTIDSDPSTFSQKSYTLSASVSDPVFEETELLYTFNQGDKIFDCSGPGVPDSSDVEDNQYYKDLQIEIITRGNILSLAYGSNAESLVYIFQKALHGNGVNGFSDLHEIRLKQNVIGSPTQSISLAASGDGGQVDDGSLSISGGGSSTSNTISAFSILFDVNGNAIGGARTAPAASCGTDLQYVTGVTGATTADKAEHTSRLTLYGFFDGDDVLDQDTTVAQDLNGDSGLIARTLSGQRPVVYYSVPQELLDQGICQQTNLGWDSNATAYTCTPSISSGDILTLQQQNAGSTIQTYYAREASAPDFPFADFATWNASRSNEEGFMFDYVMQVPVNMQKCSDTPSVPDPTPQDPLSCTIEVAATPNPALLGTGVEWTTSVSGATGDVTYSWTGSDNLDRTITTASITDIVTRSYQTTGTKNANVSVENAGRTAICTQSIPVVLPMSATCSPDTTATEAGNSVTWTAVVAGGQAPFTFAWSGTDSLTGTNIDVAKRYNNAGVKTAQVIVTDSRGTTQTVQCSPTVTITSRTPQTQEYDLGVAVIGQGSVTGDGIACGTGTANDCSQKYTEGTPVDLTPASASGWAFTGWSGSLSGDENPANLVMNGDKNVVATFRQLSGDVSSFTATPPSCTVGAGQITLSWVPASGATGYIIQRSTSPNSGFGLITDSLSTSATVNGANITVSRAGSASSYSDSGLTPGTRYYYKITPVNALGVANTSNANSLASGFCSLSCNVTADSPTGQVTHGTNINVTSSGSAVGTGTYSVDCGNGTSISGSSGQCRYPIAGAYTVTATVSKSGANPATCTTSVNATENNRVLSVSKTGSGVCTVTAPGISCAGNPGDDCAQSYTHNSNQTVTVTPASGSEFKGWGGDCSGTGSCAVTMSSNRTVIATCDAIDPQEPPSCTIDVKSRADSESTFRDGANKIAYGEILHLRYNGTNLSGTMTFSSTPAVGSFWSGSEAATTNTRTRQASGLTSVRDYTFNILGTNSAGRVCTDSVSIGVKPQIPSSGFNITTSCVAGVPRADITWNTTALADSYLVSSSVNGTESVLVDNYTAGCGGSNCEYTHDNLTSGNTYIYRLRADNEHGASPLSATRSITAPVCPSAPEADLQVVSIALDDPTQFVVGDTNRLNGVITNNGTETTDVSAWADSITIRKPDGTETTTNVAHTGVLAQGVGYALSSSNIALDQVGNYQATFCTDVGEVVNESNNNNNCRLVQFSVVPVPPPPPPEQTCEQLGNCPIVHPPVTCGLVAEPTADIVNSLVTYRATAGGGNGTYTYAWTDHTGADWGADTTTTLSTQTKSTRYNRDDDYLVSVDISSWVGTSTSATFETVTCDATHIAQPRPRLSQVQATYTRNCLNDGTIQWDRITLDGWPGRNNASIARVSRSGGTPLPTGFIFESCRGDVANCTVPDFFVEPDTTYTYNVRHYSSLATTPTPLIIQIGSVEITTPPDDCPVIPEPTCSVDTENIVVGNFARFSIDNLTYSPGQVMWNCRDEDGTDNWISDSGRGHWRMFDDGGPKDCRFVIQDGPNRWSNDSCPIVISKPPFECYAVVDGERVTEVELGTTVQWKYDINDPSYIDQTEDDWRWRYWYVLDGDPGTEAYRVSNPWGITYPKRIYWWPAWPQISMWYATSSTIYNGRRFSDDKDFFITYSTPGVKTMRGVHQVSDGSGRIGGTHSQIEECSIEVVQTPIVNQCGLQGGTDATVTEFPGAPVDPNSGDYLLALTGAITKGTTPESLINATTYNIDIDKGDGSPIVTVTTTGGNIGIGEGIAQTYGTAGTFTPRIRVTDPVFNQTAEWADCPEVTVEVPPAPSCEYDFTRPGLLRVEQGETRPFTIDVTTTGTLNPGTVDFNDSEGTTIVEGVTMRFSPVDCDPGFGTCRVQLLVNVADDAPGTGAPILATINADSTNCGAVSRSFLVDVRPDGGATIDLKVNNEDGPVKLSRAANGNLVANIFAQNISRDVLVEWASSGTEGDVTCIASQAAGGDFEGDREPNGSEIAGVEFDDTFNIQCNDNNGDFGDTVEVRIIGVDPTFEEF